MHLETLHKTVHNRRRHAQHQTVAQTMSFTTKATSGGMLVQDIELCQGVVKILMSSKFENFNRVFLDPFDVNAVPGYLEVCPKTMDLSTLKFNLESGEYSNIDEFFSDCFLIFQNAIDYHSDKDTKWIAKAAEKMLKEAKKQQSKVQKKSSAAAATTSSTSAAAGASSTVAPPKIKLKLKTSSMVSSSSPAAVAAAATPVASGAGSGGSRGKTPPTGAFIPPPDDKVKPKKTKLKLTFGKSKLKEESPGSSSTGAPASSGITKKINLVKKSISTSSVGKQLPKGVAGSPSSSTPGSSQLDPGGLDVKINIDKTSKKKSPAKTTSASSGKQSPGIKGEKMSNSKVKQLTNISRLMGNTNMTPTRKAQCWKVVNGLKRRQSKNIGWFLQAPTKDKLIKKDYNAKIKHPMDISTIQSKLDNDQYKTVGEFVLDIRRIFGNCLQFNTTVEKDSLRPVAVDSLGTAEELMTYFLAKPEHPQVAYPQLIFCWRLCLQTLDTLFNIKNPDETLPIAFFFLYPVSFFYGGQFPADYKKVVPKPMDFATIQANLVEGHYESLSQFEADCHLVFFNCLAYNEGVPGNEQICQQARRLDEALDEQMSRLNRYVSSPAGQAASARLVSSVTSASLQTPPVSLLLDILTELRNQTYTDRLTKMTEPAMTQFEKPVSVALTPDYMSYVQHPMDLQTVERKTKNAQYVTPEDFEYDVLLVFQNCIVYNTAKKDDHLVALAKNGRSVFSKIFKAKMKQLDDPSSLSVTGGIRKDPPIDAESQGPSKKPKIEPSGSSRPVPRITIKATTISEAQKLSQSRKTSKPGEPDAPKPNPSNQPVPLHIAIARVKEQFPLRRPVKSLQDWESACLRFYKEMMKHPWLSIARPQFIFHVPVPDLYPTLREVYAIKIQRPMDLTTVECTLLAGNRYAAPEDFVNDIALVFVNAIRFNKEGRDIGDPLSCAYYDASIHLLNYTRWLSLEALSEYVQDDSHVDEPEEKGLPITTWKLTSGNRQKARSETADIVLNEHIEKSTEGDSYTWTEAECEKLLKSLRHRSDEKYMQWYVLASFPPGYSNIIETPMAWERVQKKLRKRQYDKFGDIVSDLRLIFTNAMKYNAPLPNQDPNSKAAYDGAKIMSAKLETTITKMMVSVADRIERERIDHNNAEREIAAAERAEEEAIRAQWNSQSTKDGGPGVSSAASRVEASQRIQQNKKHRIVIRRKSDADFDIPDFNEEDDGQHERSYIEVMKRQKATFERQQDEMKQMRQIAEGIGESLFKSMMQHKLALEWVKSEHQKLGINAEGTEKAGEDNSEGKRSEASGEKDIDKPAAEDLLDDKKRGLIKMEFVKKHKNSSAFKRKADQMLRAYKRPSAWDDEDDDNDK